MLGGEVKVSVFPKTVCKLSARIHVGKVGTCEDTDYNLSSRLESGQMGFTFGRPALDSLADDLFLVLLL